MAVRYGDGRICQIIINDASCNGKLLVAIQGRVVLKLHVRPHSRQAQSGHRVVEAVIQPRVNDGGEFRVCDFDLYV
jgi:hypothetical protein